MDGNQVLIGKAVAKAAAIHDYIQIFFQDGAVLSVYNAFSLSGDHGQGLKALGGLTVSEVVAQPDRIRISFGKDLSLQVGMSSNDFRGPEAMMYVHGTQFIVWQPE